MRYRITAHERSDEECARRILAAMLARCLAADLLSAAKVPARPPAGESTHSEEQPPFANRGVET